MNRRSIFTALALLLLPPLAALALHQAPAPAKFPRELVRFVPVQEEPVFAGAAGQWDAKIRERGWILKEGKLWKLWYTGYDGSKEGVRRLGHATSPDGLKWARHAGNPLDKEHWIEDMMVVKDGQRYLMFAEGRQDRAHAFESADGLKWTRLGELDVRLKNGAKIPDGPFGTPTVWKEGGLWHLFYERQDLGVWLATSKDLKVWTNVQDEPVMKPGPDAYDRDLIAFNQIIKHQGRYYAYYHGSAKAGPTAGLWSLGVATSTDLIHWEKYPENPLQPVLANKSSGIVVHDGEQWRLYTMHPAVHVHVPGR